MSEWKIKGAVDAEESKSAQEQEQAVLDKAVEEGDIAPESAGKSEDEIPVINLDKINEVTEESEETQEESKPVEDVTPVEDTGVEDTPLELITEEEEPVVQADAPKVDQRAAEANEKPQIELPENVDKLVKFMQETGGTVEDYVNLNRDISAYEDGDVLREYYKQAKPWDTQDITEYMEDQFTYDDDDDPREIRSKKRAFKEELYNAREYLKGNKEKYYADLKLRKQDDIPKEYQEALEYYGEYKQSAESNKQHTQAFLQKTDKVFSESFKGFDFQVGDNKYRYKVPNISETKTQQSDINNFVSKFVGDDGTISDAKGYHKALFAARNADKLAEHFYEQGRADAIRESAKKAKNINMDPRKDNASMPKTNTSGIRAISNDDNPNKLRVKWKK